MKSGIMMIQKEKQNQITWETIYIFIFPYPPRFFFRGGWNCRNGCVLAHLNPFLRDRTWKFPGSWRHCVWKFCVYNLLPHVCAPHMYLSVYKWRTIFRNRYTPKCYLWLYMNGETRMIKTFSFWFICSCFLNCH